MKKTIISIINNIIHGIVYLILNENIIEDFLIHHTEWDMRKFDFGVYDFTIELWCKFDEEFKNEDIMILNYAFFHLTKKEWISI